MSGHSRIVIGISGGIAAYKVPALIRLLKKEGCQIKTILSHHARDLVGIEALRTVSSNPVYTDDLTNYDMDHIRLAEWADYYLICPATANSIAKIAHGIADNLLTTMALSIPQNRLIIAPAMNTVMWDNTITQHNLEMLRSRGVRVLDVEVGELACNVVGAGRMLEIDKIAQFVVSVDATAQLLRGKKVLISSGPTEEPLDPVRVITNRSTGKMGAALARVALELGAEVTVVSGPATEPLPKDATVIPIRTALELNDAMVARFVDCDICIMAAAVSDFRPKALSEQKIHREQSDLFTIELVPNPDILAKLGTMKGEKVLVGFALETHDGVARAKEKLKRKNCDFIVLNHADTALGKSTTQISIVAQNSEPVYFPDEGKEDAARRIVMAAAEKLGIR